MKKPPSKDQSCWKFFEEVFGWRESANFDGKNKREEKKE